MKQCAFLRGINVGGVKIKMADLKADFETAGFENVETVLATGNVIFDASSALTDFSFLPVKAFVRSDRDLRSMLASCPFAPDEDLHIYVWLTAPDFAQEALDIFNGLGKLDGEAAAVVNDVFYWQVPKGFTLDSPFAKEHSKKKYADKFTSRNLNTIERIVKKL
ncbi:MAG: DUF1697 domain-containing protein [Streptococcaceae bacterium]|jgi:uncharacterized protein (DUF1697 family)|nr:DUF1697 domain-containing protein [Streptococcaceae bacterium]